ncbi:7-cyano-7-deazaguanine synthase QueC [Methanogenium organophilum]|uniref:7-cyano-7-deazaguanine synthase n=1 Tax=Methanogenium organophilum TaxID=2199 RepID=A0A9X9S2F7_METOG|nr:7-cyano-7-deazaguanine synthase QueC [Methanogenium organophilum]WAI00285.1 7-cyano-7-deazaguanine synthase QueC [Methanogenium organophilum]
MKAVCLLSGGMDSSTLAYVARDMGYRIIALHLRYGQPTEDTEYDCARKIATSLDAEEFFTVNMDYLRRIGGSSLTDDSLTIGDHTGGEDGIPNTYVPFRNANLIAIATSLAEARGAEAIFIGVQASDYAGYPDCRPEFIEAFQRVIDTGTADSTHIRLMTPFVNMSKTEILKQGFALGVPYEDTWSCYRSGAPACGTCDSCYYRLAAFREVGREDPIPYEVRK